MTEAIHGGLIFCRFRFWINFEVIAFELIVQYLLDREDLLTKILTYTII